MQNSFYDYIKQLQDFENLENINSLNAIKDLNEGVFKYFPAIWDTINRMIMSNMVSLDVIQDIKDKIPVLSNCKKYHTRLLSCERSSSCSDKISSLLSFKDTLTFGELSSYEADLLELIEQNELKLSQEKAEVAKKKKSSSPKVPRQYLDLSFGYLSKGEFIEVYVDGKIQPFYSKYVDNGLIRRHYWGTELQPISMTNDDHLVVLVFRQARMKLEITIPRIHDIENNTIYYYINSSSILKKWNLDPSYMKVDVRQGKKLENLWGLRKIKPQYRIVRL